MKVQDKIYINTLNIDAGDNHWFIDESYNKANKKYDIEYIRKGALLEWANARKAALCSGESFVAGERKMLKEIIDKLNSM